MKSVSSIILMTIAAANNLEVMTGDIGNAYRNANTQEKIYTRAGIKFELVCIMAKGGLLKVIKALYGLLTTVNMWHAHLLHTLRAMVFRPTRVDPYVWIRGIKGGYNYIGTHTNDVLVASVNPTSIFNNLKETYTINTFVPPKFHLDCNYSQVWKGYTTRWVVSRSTYTTGYLMKFCAL